jgi:hypothetical protein
MIGSYLSCVSGYRGKLTRNVICFIGVALLCGCVTAPGKKFSHLTELVPDQGDVYLYRENDLYAIGDAFPVFVDGQRVGDLYNASYLVLRLAPGLHSLKVAPNELAKSSVTEIDVKPGERSFWNFYFLTGPLANPFYLGSSIRFRDRNPAVRHLIFSTEAAAGMITLQLPALFASISDVNAVPGLDQRGKEGYVSWLSKPTPRAFVISAGGKWNAAWGTKTKDFGEPKDPTERALLHCKKRGLNDCKVYALDDNVVWKK